MTTCIDCQNKPYRKRLCRKCYTRSLETKICKVDVCANKTSRRDCLCSRHYEAQRFENNRKIPCSKCGNPSLRSGLCNLHYREKINSYERERKNAAKYRRENPEKAANAAKRWRKNNPEYMRVYSREYIKHRRKTDINFRLREFARRQAWRVLKGQSDVRSLELLGCDEKILRDHLERQFQDGMTWSNWAPKGWHIDHIEPLASFDLTDEKQLKKACHYTNLQPMWWLENLSKGGVR